MNLVAPAIVLALGAAAAAVALWRVLPADLAAPAAPAGGLQGRAANWLASAAPILAPEPDPDGEGLAWPASGERSPADRVLNALVHVTMSQAGVDRRAALERLGRRARTPAARSFLTGHMRRAVRQHLRTRYRGPPALFPAWYYAVAMVRHGPRHLHLETLHAIHAELREP